MKFFTFASALICANVALAEFTVTPAMRRTRSAERAERRALAVKRGSLPRIRLDDHSSSQASNANGSGQQYSSNWAGAVLVGTGFKQVTGTMVVPTPSLPSGASSGTQYAASAWVGIDGDTCTTSILQTGIDLYIQGSSITYDAWYEWYPEYAENFNGITIKSGDQIRMTVSADSTQSGTAVIENLTSGQKVNHSFSGESAALCQTNAEWIVEDFSSGSTQSQVPFANFHNITFSNASATTGSGTVGLDGATIINMRQNNVVLTNCTTPDSSSVYCQYQ